MKNHSLFLGGAAAAVFMLVTATVSFGEVKVAVGHNDDDLATPGFQFKGVPSPARNDAASNAVFTIVDGQRDRAGGNVDKLHDGKVPAEEDQPSENFYFDAGTKGGRLLVDLGGAIDIKQVNTYSWHPDTRGPQVYTLYASDGTAEGFDAQPKKDSDPEKCGWKRIAQVDTRPETESGDGSGRGAGGGQYGVSISDSSGSIGHYRYLLFDVFPTEEADGFGNTFYSEIDVIDTRTPVKFVEYTAPKGRREVFKTDDGVYQFTIDTTQAPAVADWTRKVLVPVIKAWYPKLVQLLPSKGFDASKNVSITFQKIPNGTPAYTSGSHITCNTDWFLKNLRGQAAGAVVHEMVHVVQNFGRARRTNPHASRTPGWLVEGMADYCRWFLYEPQSHGADIRPRQASSVHYDNSYRVTANFLNWVTEKYDKTLVPKLNAACRQGNYSDSLWKQYTGHTLQELGDEWKASLQ